MCARQSAKPRSPNVQSSPIGRYFSAGGEARSSHCRSPAPRSSHRSSIWTRGISRRTPGGSEMRLNFSGSRSRANLIVKCVGMNINGRRFENRNNSDVLDSGRKVSKCPGSGYAPSFVRQSGRSGRQCSAQSSRSAADAGPGSDWLRVRLTAAPPRRYGRRSK